MLISEGNTPGTAFIVGRFQPITKMHHKIIDDARIKYRNVYVVVVNTATPSYERRFTKKGIKRKPEADRQQSNPFTLSMRVKLIKQSFEGKPINIIQAPNGFTPDIVTKLMKHTSKEKNKKKFVLMAGSDRIGEYKSQFERAGITNVDIQEIKRDMTSADNVSATRVRNSIRTDDKKEFMKLTPRGIHSEFDNMRKYIVKESFLRKMNEQININPANKEMLTCGGLGGHMLHPHDMEVKDFIRFYDSFITGGLGASEKVDGYNLFIGYNEDGKVVAARNKGDKPVTSIDQKFRLSHGGRPGFLAGFKAVKSFLERLSPADREKFRLTKDGKPKNFINLEIIYGPQPNVIPYSKDENYIVFHGLSGTKENGYVADVDGDDKPILQKMANKAKFAATIQSEPSFVKEEIKRKFTPKKSSWSFKGPIKFRGSELKKLVDNPQIQKEWARMKKELKKDGSRDKMRDISLELGGMILKSVKSKISDLPTEKDMPGIEGLVVPFGDNQIKITGDFGALYRDREKPPNFTSDLNTLVGNKILAVKLKKIDKRNVEKYGDVSSLLKERNPKKDYNAKITQDEKTDILAEIGKVEDRVKSFQGKIEGLEAKGWNSLLFDLQEFKKAVTTADTYKDLAIAFFEKLFWQKSKKMSK